MKGGPLSIVRIYLRRRSRKTGGAIGFVHGAKRVSEQAVEVSVETLPSCVELVASPDVLEKFLSAQRAELDDATIVLLDGVEISLHSLGDFGAPQ